MQLFGKKNSQRGVVNSGYIRCYLCNRHIWKVFNGVCTCENGLEVFTMPKISVIIPVFGVEKYIECCAISLFEQTLDDIEFIFIDDCTLDRSIEILKDVIEKYRLRIEEQNYSVKIVKMPVNSGLPAVRRYGIQLATGTYVAHCDSDDWVDVDLYRQLYEKIVADNADIATCDYVETNRKEVLCIRKGLLSYDKEKCIKDMMYMRTSWSMWNKLIKRNLYDNIDEYPKYYMGEDMALSLPLMLVSTKITYCPDVYYHYFINPTSSSRKHSKEDAIFRYNSVQSNLEIVKRAYSGKANAKYLKAINYMYFFQKTKLLPYSKEYEIRTLISLDLYNIIPTILFDRELNLKHKIKGSLMLLIKVLNC